MLKSEIISFMETLLASEIYDEELEMSVWKNTPVGTDLSVTNCTNSARIIAHKFSGIVYGYDLSRETDENIIGMDSFGHDFCVIDNLIIDYWAQHVRDGKLKSIIDLNDPEDISYFIKNYLPKERWEQLPIDTADEPIPDYKITLPLPSDIAYNKRTTSKPMALYLNFFNGRSHPQQKMEDWGTQGPLIGPVNISMTYGIINVFDADYESFFFLSKSGPLNDFTMIEGIYYGDMEILIEGDPMIDEIKNDTTRTKYTWEELKKIMDTKWK